MATYKTVVVGTDGSESSLRAIDRAGKIAAESNAKLIIATGYLPEKDDLRAADALGKEGYKVSGAAPVYAMLHDAHDRARAAGATDIEDRPVKGAPVHTLVDLAEEVGADLLVVGNVGLDTGAAIIGRVISIPGAVATRAKIDALIAHTSGCPLASQPILRSVAQVWAHEGQCFRGALQAPGDRVRTPQQHMEVFRREQGR